ncbi:MAG: hypothetical protein DPW09_35320 [Anaerolineae bacterium]|nr:hypothetical protein [Anaerolineae bacterium]
MSEPPPLPEQLNHLSRENERLRRENQDLARQMALLRTVARTIVDEPNRVELTRQLAEHLAELLKAERVMVGTVADEAVVFDQVAQNGRIQPVNLRFQPGEGVAGWVLIYKRPYLGSNIPSASESPDRSVLAVPILNHQGFALGVIEAHRPRQSLPFTEKDVTLVQTIALQAAPGLERAQLFDQMERWITSFESLLTFSASLNKRLEPEALTRQLVEHAAGFLGADAGITGLVTETGIVTQGYWRAGGWHEFEAHWLPLEDAGTPGWVFINQCPYLTNDYSHDKLAQQDMLAAFGVKNALCVPIMDAREEVLGFVELHNKGSGREPFTWSDANFLTSLTNSSAIAIYNARLLEELKIQRGQMQALAAQHLTLLEEERRRIARELHDEAGQALIGIKFGLQVLARKIPPEIPSLREEVDRLRRQVNEATTRLKEIAQTLRPPILDELGLEVALNRCISDFQERADLLFHFETGNLTRRLPQEVETVCYRLVQEALTNVLRHAQARQVWISLTAAERQVHLIVRDDGRGFDLKEISQTGLGLLGMRERVIMVAGAFTVESTPGAGTTITATIPLPPEIGGDQLEAPSSVGSNESGVQKRSF